MISQSRTSPPADRLQRGCVGARLAFGLFIWLVLLSPVTASSQSRPTTDRPGLVARGEYLVRIMDCGGCHTGGALLGKPDPKRLLAGSEVGFEVPGFGIAYPKNLTPVPDMGLGKWTDEEIARAIRHGQNPDGRLLAPIMPWASFSALRDADVRAIVAYLRSLPPVRFQAPANVKPGEKPTAPYMTVVQPK